MIKGWKIIIPGAVMSITTLTVLIILPVKNLLTINLAILSCVLTFKLFREKPNPKAWLRAGLSAFSWTTSFYLLASYAGFLGVLAVPVAILLVAAWRIWRGRKLFMYTVDWGVSRVKGEKKEFDFREVDKNEK